MDKSKEVDSSKVKTSQTKNYVTKFLKIQKKYNISIIEVHNRPSYINQLSKNIGKTVLYLYFHNDPLSMDGSKTIDERKKLLKTCYKIRLLIVIYQFHSIA